MEFNLRQSGCSIPVVGDIDDWKAHLEGPRVHDCFDRAIQGESAILVGLQRQMMPKVILNGTLIGSVKQFN